jgi:hypothetical protein
MRNASMEVLSKVADGIKSLQLSPTLCKRKPSREPKRAVGAVPRLVMAVRDPQESVAFCVKLLGCTMSETVDPSLVGLKFGCVRLPGGEGAAE